jgi:ribonuclease T1
MKRWQPVVILLAIFALWWWQGGNQDSRTEDASPASAHAPAAQSAKLLLALPHSGQETASGTSANKSPSLPDFLPGEAHRTIELILRGGPFPHRQDGAVFGNREKRLPRQPHGYYREYTVRTPGERDRGARRIVAGGDPPREFWYTADHYRTFRHFEVAP